VLGNSQAQALSNFGLIRDADFVTRVGLSIHQVLTSKNGDAPIAQLNGKQYEKAVFIFGENELGWPYPENFITHYKKVIAKVRELNPGVEVYCQAIFPVSAEYSEKSTNGITNENVRAFNALIEKMCGEIDAHFMPVSDAFFDRDGALPAGAATDGVHFGYDYCKIWAGDLSAFLQAPTEDAQTVTETETTQEGVTQA
jgi:lysophospholipase L1-like esterase